MQKEKLTEIAQYLVNPPKGILAADESTTTCCKRFEGVGIDCTEESRRAFRQLLITTPELGTMLSGIILVEETLGQNNEDGTPFTDILKKNGIKAGIKVDGGITGYPDEHSIEFVTKGLDTLEDRLPNFHKQGAEFAKWRAAFPVIPKLPTDECLAENIRTMREYAILCQNNSIVPIIEPEVLMDGTHNIDEAEATVEKILTALFADFAKSEVYLPGLILKTSMVLSGKTAERRADSEEVGKRTVHLLKKCVPEDIGGVIFLSGGQDFGEANANYDAIMIRSAEVRFPMTYSFSRAFQNDVLEYYAKNPDHVADAQMILMERIREVVRQ